MSEPTCRETLKNSLKKLKEDVATGRFPRERLIARLDEIKSLHQEVKGALAQLKEEIAAGALTDEQVIDRLMEI
jgi:uncharacterized protein Smg (DUF494 family)